MSGRHYSKFIGGNQQDLTLRDYLAIDRTLLANERSFLAYVRTAITLFIAAISLMKFFDAPMIQILGQVILAGALVTFIQGVRRFRATEHIISELEGIQSEVQTEKGIGAKVLHFSQELVRAFYK